MDRRETGLMAGRGTCPDHGFDPQSEHVQEGNQGDVSFSHRCFSLPSCLFKSNEKVFLSEDKKKIKTIKQKFFLPIFADQLCVGALLQHQACTQSRDHF